MLCAPLVAAPAAVHLAPGVPVLVPAGTPDSVHLAVEDLRRDLQKVLGAVSPLVADAAELYGRSAIVILGPSTGAPELHDAKIAGREAHGIHVR
jgi:hypothetical protein